jgi:hypothetical protein
MRERQQQCIGSESGVYQYAADIGESGYSLQLSGEGN